MDSRATEVTNHLDALPDELKLEIFKHLDVKAVTRMQQASMSYNNLLNDHIFWMNKHDKQFLPTPFNADDDNKNQYKAAWLYHLAKSYTAHDHQQIRLKKFTQFLKQNHQPWTHYYRGLLYFNGEGVKRDIDSGFLKLLDSLDIHDYRAAIKIAHILLESKLNDTELYEKLIKIAGKQRLQLMTDLLVYTHENAIARITKLLGRLYALGVGIEADFKQTEKYFLREAVNLPNDIAEIAHLKFDSLPDTIVYEQKVEQTIAYLKTLIGIFPANKTQSVIDYWSGYLALCRGENAEAIRLLQSITDLPIAKVSLAQILENTGQPALAANELLGIVNSQEDIARELFDMHRQIYSSLHECIERTKSMTNCQNIELADKVSAELRDNDDMETLAQDPDTVWWIQLAAQAGCTQSLDALLSVDAESYPYICYALAIINEFGILHSDLIEPNHDRAEYYFNLARKFHNLDVYLLTAIGGDFACNEVLNFLQNKLDSSLQNNRI